MFEGQAIFLCRLLQILDGGLYFVFLVLIYRIQQRQVRKRIFFRMYSEVIDLRTLRLYLEGTLGRFLYAVEVRNHKTVHVSDLGLILVEVTICVDHRFYFLLYQFLSVHT